MARRSQYGSRMWFSATRDCLGRRLLFLVSMLVLFIQQVFGQTVEITPSVGELKKMTLEQLVNLDVTSVSRQPEPYGEAPAAIVVITGDEIRRSGASSLPEALRLADNLEVAQVSSSGWDISARGFNSSVSDKLLVLIDGRCVYTPLFAGVIWGKQDYLLADIDRIEVISGPGGTLWGANAVNGVINITSKSAKDTQGLYLEAGGGSWLQDLAGMRYGGALAADVHYRVYGKYFDRASQSFADGTNAMDPWNYGQGGFRLDAGEKGHDQATFQGDLYTGDTHVVPGGEGMPAAQGTQAGGNLLGRWVHTFADDSDVTLQLYYDRTHLEAPFQASGAVPAGTLVDDMDTFDMDLQARVPLADWNHVIGGLGHRYTHDEDQYAPVVAFIPNVLDRNLFSAFVQDEIKPFPGFSFILGSKIEHNDYTGYEFEPNGRIRLDLASQQMVWAAVSRAVRAPSRYDRDLAEPSPAYGVFLGANTTFQSETVVAYELGYRAQWGGDISTSLSTFFNQYDNLRGLALTPVLVLPLYFTNSLAGQTGGLELTTDYQAASWWRLHLGYDLLLENLWVKAGQLDLSQGLAETADPRNQVFLRSSIDLSGGVELDAHFRWIDSVNNSSLGASTLGVLPSYAELDLRLGWHVTRELEISAVGQNLLQDHHVEAGVPDTSQESIARSVYGKAAIAF